MRPQRTHPVTETIEFKKSDKQIVYEDKQKFKPTERVFANDVILIHLKCEHKGCKRYIRGLEHYNGYFVSETGTCVDLREKGFVCDEHS